MNFSDRRPSFNEIRMEINRIGWELLYRGNDGWTQFDMKKKLYELKWIVDSYLERSGTFVGEDEFLEEREKHLMWDTLKK